MDLLRSRFQGLGIRFQVKGWGTGIGKLRCTVYWLGAIPEMGNFDGLAVDLDLHLIRAFTVTHSEN